MLEVGVRARNQTLEPFDILYFFLVRLVPISGLVGRLFGVQLFGLLPGLSFDT